MSVPNCIFCKIIANEIPSEKIYETENIFAFMDINPLSEGHCLFIPKKHAVTAHETDDKALAEILIVIKKVANAMNYLNYNILQNNGRIAHQEVFHSHWHLIPKPNDKNGLKIKWEPITDVNQKNVAERIRKTLS